MCIFDKLMEKENCIVFKFLNNMKENGMMLLYLFI